MRVLWLSPTPSLFDEKKIGGWITSLEVAVKKYAPETQFGIVFEYLPNALNRTDKNVTYYPICSLKSYKDKILSKIDFSYYWKKAKTEYLSVIQEFKPDLIECFGSEWEYGLISREVDIPVLIHMQGFLNIQNYCTDIVNRGFNKTIVGVLKEKRNDRKINFHNEQELLIMRNIKYFIGRTEWDKNLVRYYSPNAKYFNCNETLREGVYTKKGTWNNKPNKKPILLTITQGSPVKGNEIILQTANILKNQFYFEFEWRVAGNINDIIKYEKLAKIKFNDVNVKLIGMIDCDTVARELANADLFINCSINDNSPNSICEAQLIGCPVVSSNVGGIPSIVDNGVTGLLYPYNEPHTLAFQIMNLLQNKEKMKYLSENEINVASKRHNPKEIVNNLINIYEEIIEG